MKRRMRWLALLLALMCIMAPAGQAEDDDDIDISDWASAQEAATSQVEWASMQGAEVNTAVQAQNITKKCKFKVSEGSKSKLTDSKVSTSWTYDHSDAWVGVTLPDGVTPGAIRIEWLFDPTGFELTEYDASQNPIRTRTQDDYFPCIYMVFALDANTRSIQLKMTAADQGVGNIVVYSEGVLPAGVQTWLPPVEKADMMVISTHQDDEVIFLGGTIPYSDVVRGRPTVTVYMANCNRERRREALEGLWEMGSRHYPEFVNLKDEKVSSVEKGLKLWGGKENVLKEMVARIRRYKPEVIVTQDLDGEYGHNQHKIVAAAAQPAIEAAADPTQYPESYEQYGAWQVKKLYIHLYKENQIHMDWKSPQDAFDGESLLDVAKRGMAKHASQTKYFKVRDGGQYDNALFGLALSTVGEDVMKNDFFENIPLDSSAVETAAATDDGWEDAADDGWEDVSDDGWEDAPAEEPTEVGIEPEGDGDLGFEDAADDAFAPEPTIVPAPEPEVANERGGNGLLIGIVAVVGLALIGGGAWAYLQRQAAAKRKKKRRRKGKKRSQTAAKGKKVKK
ncbi:MAG: PIG-L family deacetylase [Clostridia bacterium]|nr:PIG-L family deacetylase [Clostridia bacterium]